LTGILVAYHAKGIVVV